MSIVEELKVLKQKSLKDILDSTDLNSLNSLRVTLLGKKGSLTSILRGMKDLSNEERPEVGQIANEIRDQLTNSLDERKKILEEEQLNKQLSHEQLDVTLPGWEKTYGNSHVIQTVIDKIVDLFLGMNYRVIEGSEIELENYNFERLNLPKNHPARDMQDTFYLNDDNNELLLRSQTSAVQVRALEQHDFSKGALKIISPGVVYRRDTDDATHSHQFHQIEGLVVDENISMSDLKGTLQTLLKHLFGERLDIRFRPSYFPFTEPSIEADVTCFKCLGEGCFICKNKGWIEVLGAGLVHPNVLKQSGVDPEKYSGFAFGLGPDRLAMLQYGVQDIRDFYLSDVRFSSQFN